MSPGTITSVDVSRAIVYAEAALKAEIEEEKAMRNRWGARECDDADRMIVERIARLEAALRVVNSFVSIPPNKIALLLNEAAAQEAAIT